MIKKRMIFYTILFSISGITTNNQASAFYLKWEQNNKDFCKCIERAITKFKVIRDDKDEIKEAIDDCFEAFEERRQQILEEKDRFE